MSLNKTLKNVLPNYVKTSITYTGQKLNSRYQIKDKANEKHKRDLIYYGKYFEPSLCAEDYSWQSGPKIMERTADHARL